MSLNDPQQKAVQTIQGRILVLAGAGSGKTKVLVHRIAHMIQGGILPEAILGLTFTNKAAQEMQHRLEQLIGEKGKKVFLSTFHSFCMQILRKEIEKLGYTKNFTLYDEREIKRLVNPEMSQDLQVVLRAYNAVSFDSLITLAIQLFEEHPEILEKYQDRYRYILIDEYQDTNIDQFRLAELMAKKYGNLFVVGDDDQSIYGWRGAEVKNILQFRASLTVKLEQNYRSTPVILEAANAVIAKNKNRHAKKLWSQNNPTKPIEIFNAPTDIDEAAAIIQRIIRYKNEGFQWKDIAILYRSNSQSRLFEMSLIQQKIPYEIYGGLEFSERSEIKDLMAYLRVIINPLDQEAILRIINVPRRGISETFLDQLTQKNRTQNIPLWDVLTEIADEKISFPQNPRGVSGVKAFVNIIRSAQKRFGEGPLSEAALWLIETVNYKKAIEEEVKSEKMRLFKWENVQEFANAIAQHSGALVDFVSNAALDSRSFNHKKHHENKVSLMTLHSAKGLEFPVCFIVGIEEGILPHEKNFELEEERRLFYVGITRAQKFLTLSMAQSRMKMGKTTAMTPSRFLYDIPKTCYKVNDYKIFV